MKDSTASAVSASLPVEADDGSAATPEGSHPSGLPAAAARLHRLRDPKAHPVIALGLGAALFLSGAVAASMIDRGLSSVIPDAEIEAAREQQALIADRTDNIGQGVQRLQTRLDALAADPSSADLAAIRADAEAVLTQMREIAPMIQDAAIRNASLTANLRAAELARTGASTTAALVIPDNSSATVCRDFTIGVRRFDSTGARFSLSRQGQVDEDILRSGQSVALEQADAAASVSFAGIRGTDPLLYGIDFNCYAGTEQG